MGKISFALQSISYLLLFVIIISLLIFSPIPSILKFMTDPFRSDVSISTLNSVYDEELGRLKLVIQKDDDVNGKYLSFTFYPESQDREYAFLRKTSTLSTCSNTFVQITVL